MANTITAFLENLVAATADFNSAVVGQTAFIDGVYTAVQPEVANRDTKTITIPFPDFGAFTDIGAGDLTDSDLSPNSVTLNFTAHPAASYKIRDLEEWQTGSDLRRMFLDPMYMRAAEYLNGDLATLFTSGNFNVNPVIQGSTPGEVTVADTLLAWDYLAGQKVPLNSADDLSLFVHNNAYRRMLADSAWVQESLVGRGIAETARTQGSLPNAFKFQPRWDQQAPKTVTPLAGTATATNGSATVTGSGTNFTNALIGQVIQFAGDTQAGLYKVTAVGSTTSLTIASNYAGATVAGTVVSTVSFSAVAMHRYAIALGLRPLPPPDTTTVHYMPLMYRGIPLRVMMSYQHRNVGWLMSVDFGYGRSVIRPAFGVLITH